MSDWSCGPSGTSKGSVRCAEASVTDVEAKELICSPMRLSSGWAAVEVAAFTSLLPASCAAPASAVGGGLGESRHALRDASSARALSRTMQPASSQPAPWYGGEPAASAAPPAGLATHAASRFDAELFPLAAVEWSWEGQAQAVYAAAAAAAAEEPQCAATLELALALGEEVARRSSPTASEAHVLARPPELEEWLPPCICGAELPCDGPCTPSSPTAGAQAAQAAAAAPRAAAQAAAAAPRAAPPRAPPQPDAQRYTGSRARFTPEARAALSLAVSEHRGACDGCGWMMRR